jgi:hypothetical protein
MHYSLAPVTDPVVAPVVAAALHALTHTHVAEKDQRRLLTKSEKAEVRS